MCGRYTLRSPPKAIAEAFGLADLPDLRPRYNIAPTQQVLAILLDHGKRQARLRRWGLVPSWAKDSAIGYKLINARSDGVADKPSFRSAFKRGRCLVVADGFYEWKKVGKSKQPYFIRLKTEKPFAFAGLSEHWHRDDEMIDSCSLIATEPNELMATIHDRMPAILPPEAYDVWLDRAFEGKEELLALLRPYAQRQKGFHVERLDRFDDSECLWQEALVEDRRAGPAEIAATRLDFASWLRLLTRRQRKIALVLASGESTTEAAKKFKVTQGAISQFRQRLRRSWERFQGEADGGQLQAAAA